MLKRIKSLFINKTEESELRPMDRFLPLEKRCDDIYLVSYPKSGVTWVSFMIANMMVEKLRLDMEVNLFNIHGFIPDIHAGREVPLDLGFFPFKRMMKSHSPYHPEYNNIIYILRDPRSVMVSFHKYMTGLGRYDGNISEFIRNRHYGIGAWVNHVGGWTSNASTSTRFRVFRYEDILSNTEESAMSLAGLLGVRLTTDEMARILQKCSFDHMRSLEDKTGSLTFKKYDKNFRFVREGRMDGWRQVLSGEDTAYINAAARELMERFNYE